MSCPEFNICQDIIGLLPIGLRSYWSDGLAKGKLDVTIGLILLQLTGLASVELRMRDSSAIGSPAFDALTSSLAVLSHHDRYPNIRSVKISIDRQLDEPSANFVEHAEIDIFNTHAYVPKLLQFKNLEYVDQTP